MKSNNIDISIIILNYKSWIKLAKCLESLEKFGPKCTYEMIVVDNYSNDGQFNHYVKKYNYVKFIENDGNNGFSNGCNLGANEAKGKYFLFLNPDTVLTESSSIDKMLNFLVENKNVGIVSCSKISENGRREREIAFLNPWLTIGLFRAIYKFINKDKLHSKFNQNKLIWYPDWIAGSVMLISQDLFNSVGKFDDNNFWMYFEDVDLCKKVRDNGFEIALLRDVNITHIHGVSSRINPTVSAMTKSEVIISSHMFVNKYTNGINRILLNFLIAFKSLLSNLIVLLLDFRFWKPKYKSKILLMKNLTKYYYNLVVFRRWKSPRIKH